jgi:hypothetical protein
MKIFAFISMLILVGCTNARISQSLSSGAIGCPAKQIKITEERAPAEGVHDWVAECKGIKYACNYNYPNPATCKEIK